MRTGLVRWMWVGVLVGAGVAGACGLNGTNDNLTGGGPGAGPGDTPDGATSTGTGAAGDAGDGINKTGTGAGTGAATGLPCDV